MPRKAFEVKVELDIQAATCPGVWLCPSGKVSIQLYMLGSCIQTASLQPVFPLLYHETFIFYKTFHTVHRLSHLQKLLNKEWMYAELIQWQNCEIGNVLASFKTTLSELLYPNIKDGAIPGVDMDLLMEPTKSFPGIISPKLEVSTRTTIEEKLCVNDEQTCEPYVVNPKVLTSKCLYRPAIQKQRKVCHSAGYHGSRVCDRAVPEEKRERFLYRRVDDNLIARKPQGLKIVEKHCNCKSSQTLEPNFNYNASPVFDPKIAKTCRTNIKWARKINPKNADTSCSHGGAHGDCPTCAKYKYYFEPQEPPISPNFILRAENAVEHTRNRPRCSVHPKKICLCPVSKESGNKSTRRVTDEGRLCNCNGTNLDTGTCMCCTKIMKSLAKKLHDRLSKTLNCSNCPSYRERDTNVRNFRSASPICESSCSPALCQLNEDVLSDKCTDWYGSFDRFYKNFYKDKRDICQRYIAC